MKTEQDYEKEFDRLYEEGKVAEGVLDDDLPDFRDDWITERMREDGVCEMCGGTGEVTTMERVYHGEPHMADIGVIDCPSCKPTIEQEFDDQSIDDQDVA